MSPTHKEQMQAYGEAVRSGLYAKQSGLVGKYDNVRRLWEDEISRRFLRPHLTRLIDRCQEHVQRLRVMDLGCGSADGYELLSGVRQRDADLQDVEIALLSPEILGYYKGIDLSVDLLNQGRTLYGSNPKMVFEKADFTRGLPIKEGEKGYDLYFTSFGACSHHNDDETLIQLLAEIASRTEYYSVIVCDWLGRYSYEWQTLWTNDLSENRNMDYVVSYIYEPEEREARRTELQHLLLRLMSRQEIDVIIKEASDRAGVEIRPLEFFDRSVLTGRHSDTGEYNPHAQPLRLAVNSLHEVNVRTDLSTLLFDYVPKDGFDSINDYFEHLQLCWNSLVRYVGKLLEAYNEERRCFDFDVPSIPPSYPSVLLDAAHRMRLIVEGVGWLGFGLPRENIIEPQLGYALRELVTELQQGQGRAHGLVGIFEVDKQKKN